MYVGVREAAGDEREAVPDVGVRSLPHVEPTGSYIISYHIVLGYSIICYVI